MKKFFVLLILIFAMLLSVGCGGSSSEKTKETTSNEIPQWDPKKGSIDLSDRKNYFVLIDGKKYDLNTNIATFFNDGYAVYDLENMKQEVRAGKYIANDIYFRKNGETYFCMQPINRTDKTITKEECTVYSISIQDTWYTDATIIGGITIGSSRQEVEEVFGMEFGLGTSEEYRMLCYGEVLSYGFNFSFDESWQVISMMVYSYAN